VAVGAAFAAPVASIMRVPNAVTSAMRREGLPDVPTVGDFVPGFEATAVGGIGVPANTPIDIIEALNREVNAGLSDPKIRARLSDLAGTVLALSAAEYGKLLAVEVEKWSKAVKFSGAKPD
jgi:tripartite-type tricarboxylate transporter receptor subunit TctC